MTLFSICILLIAIGVLLWAVNTYIPMQQTIKSIMNCVVIVFTALWLLHVFGLISVYLPLT